MGMVQTLVAFLGRALLSIIFIASGANKVFNFQGTLTYFNQALNDWLALNVGNQMLQGLIEWGLANASMLLAVGAAIEIIAGLMVFLGIWTRLGAFLLIVFLIPVTLVFHHFWQLLGADRELQMIMFLKNVSIAGGLLVLLAFGNGPKKSPKKDEKKV
ncbi:MAG: DoxX family protein [Candidatus Melainabacteria bacterium]|nr:DoxX family protein [Candidatus Melainabacteria bacterium]